MTGDKTYQGVASFPLISGEVSVQVGLEGLSLRAPHSRTVLDFSQLRSFELRNFQFLFETTEGKADITRMGRDTDGFYAELWNAYAERTRESLFVEEPVLMEASGDYSYADDGGTAKGEAMIRLYPGCVLILPRDNKARRIPLCFVEELSINSYTISIKLDTDERYELIRLGRDTIPLFDQLQKRRDEVQRLWEKAHQDLTEYLDSRLGDARERFQVMKRLCGNDMVFCGVFAPESQEFWLAAIHKDRAVVELITEEKTATYTYQIRGPVNAFVLRLRHAMEAIGLHREVLYLEENEMRRNTLYIMSVERNAHLRFLRECISGRVIHTETWEKRLAEMLLMEKT
jgi:hypothetical protein